MVRQGRHTADDAEVEHLRHVAAAAEDRDEDVRGTQVTVDEALPVRLGDRTADLTAQEDGAARGHRPGPADDVGDAEPRQKLHGAVRRAVARAAEIEDADGVGVQQPGRRLHLPVEPGRRHRVSRPHEFDRARPLELVVFRQIDVAYPAIAERTQQAIGAHAVGLARTGVAITVRAALVAAQHPGRERREHHAHDEEQGVGHDDLMVRHVVHVEVGGVGMVQHGSVAENQSGRHRHRDPRRRRRSPRYEDAAADHQHDRSDHAVFLYGDSVDQVATVDEIDHRQVLCGQNDQHLEAEQAALHKPHMPPAELQRRQEKGTCEPAHSRPQQQRPCRRVGRGREHRRGTGRLDQGERQVEDRQESGDRCKPPPQLRCRDAAPVILWDSQRNA